MRKGIQGVVLEVVVVAIPVQGAQIDNHAVSTSFLWDHEALRNILCSGAFLHSSRFKISSQQLLRRLQLFRGRQLQITPVERLGGRVKARSNALTNPPSYDSAGPARLPLAQGLPGPVRQRPRGCPHGRRALSEPGLLGARGHGIG